LVTQLNNVAEAEIKGFELEVLGVVASGFTVNGGLGYTDAEFTDVGSAAAVGLTTDTKFSRTPKWTFNIGAQYEQELSNGTVLYRVDYSWRDKTQAIELPQPLIDADSFGLLNLRIAYEHGDDRWGLALYGTNLTDERYFTGGRTDRPWFNRAAYGRPSEWGVSTHYSF